MAVYDANIRFESQLPRINCRTFSFGFSSGHFAGGGQIAPEM